MRTSKRWLALVVSAIAGTAGVATVNAPAASAGPLPYSVVASYYASWDIYGRNYNVVDIPATKINTLLYGFGKAALDSSGKWACDDYDRWADYQSDGVPDLGPNSDIDSRNINGNFKQLLKLKALHPNLHMLMSIGGWANSDGLSQAAATAAGRQYFVASCIKRFLKGDLPVVPGEGIAGGDGVAAGLFDGIDIDWEYPAQASDGATTWTPADKHNFTLLLQEFRTQLNAYGTQTGKRYSLTAALAPGSARASAGYEIAQIADELDLAFIMDYDFHGDFGNGETKTDFNSPFTYDPASPMQDPSLTVQSSIQYYLSHGLPTDKTVLGVPFFARQYAGVSAGSNNGLYQTFDNTGFGTDPTTLDWDKVINPTYHDLVDIAQIVTSDCNPVGQNGFVRSWRSQTGEPWLYNPTTHRFITYEDPASVEMRVDWAIDQDLRGVFAWDISHDDNDHDLIDAFDAMF